MPNSIAELITDDLVDTLQTIQKVSGYHFDMVVEREGKSNIPLDSKIILSMEPPEKDDSGALGHETWFLNYVITVYLATSDAWEQTIVERMALAYSDIHTALIADPHRGAFALNSEIGSAQYNNEAGEMPSIDIPYKVHFRHTYGQPNVL